MDLHNLLHFCGYKAWEYYVASVFCPGCLLNLKRLPVKLWWSDAMKIICVVVLHVGSCSFTGFVQLNALLISISLKMVSVLTCLDRIFLWKLLSVLLSVWPTELYSVLLLAWPIELYSLLLLAWPYWIVFCSVVTVAYWIVFCSVWLDLIWKILLCSQCVLILLGRCVLFYF